MGDVCPSIPLAPPQTMFGWETPDIDLSIDSCDRSLFGSAQFQCERVLQADTGRVPGKG